MLCETTDSVAICYSSKRKQIQGVHQRKSMVFSNTGGTGAGQAKPLHVPQLCELFGIRIATSNTLSGTIPTEPSVSCITRTPELGSVEAVAVRVTPVNTWETC